MANRSKLEEILSQLLPVEELVPPIYEQWRPVVRDGFGFIAARLSPDRLTPKIIEQLKLPSSTPVEDRVIAFIRRVPVLQKIGQTLARNASLDPSFRSRLTVLEDGIQDVEESEIRAELEKQLAGLLAEHRVNLQPGIYGEGSVSALVAIYQQELSGYRTHCRRLQSVEAFHPRLFQRRSRFACGTRKLLRYPPGKVRSRQT